MTIKELLSASRFKMIALDDDPTGIQTVHGCLLITDWSAQNLKTAFEDECDFFYMLTNTRAMTAAQAAEVTRSAMEAILEANKEFNYQLIFVSRSDSTLRGHFPLETDIMHECLEKAGIARLPLTIFAPAFIEVGRLSIDGTHYLKDTLTANPVNPTKNAFPQTEACGNAKDRLEAIAEAEICAMSDFGFRSDSELVIEIKRRFGIQVKRNTRSNGKRSSGKRTSIRRKRGVGEGRFDFHLIIKEFMNEGKIQPDTRRMTSEFKHAVQCGTEARLEAESVKRIRCQCRSGIN